MSFMPAHRAGNLGRSWVSPWTPADLGASLYAWWDASRADLITQSGGLVSSWKDSVAGYDAVQAVGASKPTYSATGFNGFAVVSADGVDDELTVTGVPAAIPTGANPVCEEWYLVDQPLAAGTDSANRNLGSYGGAASGSTRRVQRATPSGVNRARAIDGGNNLNNTGVNFTDRHVIRVVANGSTINIEVDGIAAAGIAQSVTISTARLRFFADALSAASVFGQCGIAARLFTALLSADDASRMYAYLNRRK